MSLWRRVLHERRRTVVPLLALLAINGAVLGLAVVPLKSFVASSADRARATKFALAQAQITLHQAQAARLSRDRADVDLKKFYAEVLPADFASARQITYLEIARIGQECGLQAGPRGFEPVRIKDSQLGEFKTDVTFTGEYPAIRKFIYELETAQSFLVLRSVALGQASQQQKTGPAVGSLQVSVQISTFYRAGMP
jgi:hypothetical protein